jgi:hypothetical protein
MWFDLAFIFDKLLLLACGVQVVVFGSVFLAGIRNTYKDWKRKNTHV